VVSDPLDRKSSREVDDGDALVLQIDERRR
jgi:hypothetical protein